jgi:uncharacterized protein
MELLIICIAAFGASVLTFFSGFGLGTLLTPVLAVFFPVDIAIALTGIVHLANNLFKLALVGRKTDFSVVLRFGLPAILTSFLGAWLLIRLSTLNPIHTYQMWDREFQISLVNLIVALLLVVFAVLELSPRFRAKQFDRKLLPAGGLLSGFFGGLTGMQGAIRSAFLLKSGLTKEAYIATGVLIACLIDFARISVYSSRFTAANLQDNLPLLLSAVLSAFAGAYLGSKLLRKITLHFIQNLVAVMLIGIAIALGSGWL